jgi:hypothetical protein
MKIEEKQVQETEHVIILSRAEYDAILKITGLTKINRFEIYDEDESIGGNYENVKVEVED